MWGQTWVNLFPLLKPFPSASEIDLTSALLEKNYTVLRMFETSDEFYKSLGLESSNMSYDERLGAVIEKPKDREIMCHPSAWDFLNGKDFRFDLYQKRLSVYSISVLILESKCVQELIIKIL